MKFNFVGVFFTLFSLVFLAVGGTLAEKQARSLRSFRPTDARVLGTDLKVVSGDESDTYAPIVHYQYTVNRQSYEGTRVMPVEISSSRGWAQEITGRFTVGQSTVAYYNPVAPNDAYLVHEASFFPYIFILGPMIFTCIGLMLLFNDRTPGAESFTLDGPPTVPTVVWNVVGIAVAAHYFSVADHMDLTAEVAFMIYGLIGATLLYATVQMRRHRVALPASP